MKKLLNYSWLILLMTVCLAACSDGGDDPGTPDTPKPDNKPELTVPTTENLSPTFDEAGGTATVSFTATSNWTASVTNTRADSWISVSPTSGGKGNATLNIKTSANDTPDERNATITLKCGTVSKTISVVQKQKDALTVTTTKYEVGKEGGEIEVEVKANVDFNIVIPETSKEWIKEVKSKSRALETHQLLFSVDANGDTENREGEIIIQSGDMKETVHVYQEAGGKMILLTKNEYVVGTEGETIQVELKSNCDYTVQMPDVDWIKESSGTRALSTHTLYFEILSNEGYDNRSADIVFTDAEQSVSDTLHIVQKDVIVISQKNYEMPAAGGSLELEYSANVDCELISNFSWITEVEESRGLTPRKAYFRISANKNIEKRKGYILVHDKKKQLTDTVYVEQLGGYYIEAVKNEYTIGCEKETIEIELESNCFLEYISPTVSWINFTEGSTSYDSDKTAYWSIQRFVLDANDTGKERTSEIIFKQKDGTACDTVRITQLTTPINEIRLSEKEFIIPLEGKEFDVDYKTNTDCLIEIPEDYKSWISAADASSRGMVDKKLHVKVEANTTEEDRIGKIVLYDTEKTVNDTIYIKQKGNNYYLDIPNHDEQIRAVASSSEGIYDFVVLSNGDYKFEIIGKDTSWIHHLRREKIEENCYKEIFQVNENKTGKLREVSLQFSLGFIVKNYGFAQAEKRALILSQTEFNVPAEGGSYPLEVRGDGEWANNGPSAFYNITIPTEAQSWITYESNPNAGCDNAKIIVQPNLTSKRRSATITLEGHFSYNFQTILISQSETGAIVLSESNYILSSQKHTINVDLATSDYTVEIDSEASSWISLGQKSGEGENSKLELLIAENTSKDERKGNVLFTSGTSKNQISITQLMVPPALVDDAPEKWKQFKLSEVELIFMNPNAIGSQIYKAIVPDCEELINITSRKVLDRLYDDPSNELIPATKEKLEYVLEDMDGVSYNANSGMRIVLGNQYLANFYYTHGAEAMIKENISVLTHELTHTFQASPKNCGGYEEGTHFFAFIEGVADAVRILCGGFREEERPKGGHYMNAYRYGGFFIAWLVKNKDENFLRKFNESAHVLETWTFEAGVKYALGEDADAEALWTEYQKAMGDI